MNLEDKLANWTGPSSATEQDKQDRTERMIREAIKGHRPFDDCSLRIYAKGSYANNTNVKADSDVDIAVQCREVVYGDAAGGGDTPGDPYTGVWTPRKLRAELQVALEAKFPGQVDSSGSTAFTIDSGSARVEADVVPCFDYKYYFSSGGFREGVKVFKTDGGTIENYPVQQLENGRAKNIRTNQRYKQAVRIMKRVENAMVLEGVHREVPSYFVECLVYNCRDEFFKRSSWTSIIEGIIGHVWEGLKGPEPDEGRWLESNDIKYLFHASQKWTREDGRDFILAAWKYLGYDS
jgi:predicted nucleotidyltransferase